MKLEGEIELVSLVDNSMVKRSRIKKTMKKQKTGKGEKHLERVRRICLALPETMEKLSHGEPTFFVRKKVFGICSNNHHNDGHVAVLLPAAIGVQAALIEANPVKFYRPAYVGVRGWIGIELDQVDDEELGLHVQEAWRLIAPEKLQVQAQQSLNVKSAKQTSQRQTIKRTRRTTTIK